MYIPIAFPIAVGMYYSCGFFGITAIYFPSENVFAKGSDSDSDCVLQRILGRLLLLYVTRKQLKSSRINVTNAWESEVQLTFGLLIFTST